MKYFSNLPIISYSNNYVRNILTRIKFVDKFKESAGTYYPYVQTESTNDYRYENLAYDYYDDSEDVWLLHLFNEVIDPYYDVALSQEDFDKFIVKKYGSLRNAYQKIVFYRNNYDQDDSFITQSGYNALPEETKRYWFANVNFNNNVIGYERIKENTIVSTNRIISFQTTLVGNTQFIQGEKVVQGDSSGFISFSNSSVITLQHISGFVDESGNVIQSGNISGDQSLANAEITSANLIFNAFGGTTGSMSPNEEVYFSPVIAFDYENELNEQKKNIKILNKNLAQDVYSTFKEIF